MRAYDEAELASLYASSAAGADLVRRIEVQSLSINFMAEHDALEEIGKARVDDIFSPHREEVFDNCLVQLIKKLGDRDDTVVALQALCDEMEVAQRRANRRIDYAEQILRGT